MVGAYTRGDFEHCEVALFLGKNPWHSHCIPRARVTLKEIAADPARTMIVVDPRRTETAELADIHLPVRPGGDAWLLAAMIAMLVQEGLVAAAWVAEHTRGVEQVAAALRDARRRGLLRQGAASTRRWCATPRGASPQASSVAVSRTSACR